MDSALPPFLRETAEGVYLAVKVQPRASRNQLGGLHGNELKVAITAPPVDSAANEALVRFIAEVLGCHRSSVTLARGHTSRHKLVLVRGLSAGEILGKLPMASGPQ